LEIGKTGKIFKNCRIRKAKGDKGSRATAPLEVLEKKE